MQISSGTIFGRHTNLKPPQPKLVEVEALVAFTHTTDHGQFHGDPSSKRNRRTRVPDYAVQELAEAGKIKRPSGFVPPAPADE